jgi:hypothetical protein
VKRIFAAWRENVFECAIAACERLSRARVTTPATI